MSETILQPATLTIDLAPAINFDGRDYSQLVLREPKVGEVRQADEQLRNGMTASAMRNREIHLVAKCSGVPVPVVEKIRISEHNQAIGYINAFLDAGRETGAS